MLKVVFNIMHTKFFWATFTTQPQLFFVFLQFEGVSNKNTLELRNGVLLSEKKLHHVNTKATSVYSFVNKTNI